MSDLISRQAAIDALEEYLEEYDGLDERGLHSEKWCAMSEAKMAIEALPSAQPERKKGKWERHYCEDGNPDGWRCDKCDEWYYFGQTLPNFCPNCGADMRGEQE